MWVISGSTYGHTLSPINVSCSITNETSKRLSTEIVMASFRGKLSKSSLDVTRCSEKCWLKLQGYECDESIVIWVGVISIKMEFLALSYIILAQGEVLGMENWCPNIMHKQKQTCAKFSSSLASLYWFILCIEV